MTLMRNGTDGGASGGRRRAGRIIGVVLVVVLLALFLAFRRQTVSYLTHWTGGPEDTTPYEPWPEDPDVHLAAIGDMGDSGPRLDSVAAEMTRVADPQQFDALILLGDNVYPDGDPGRIPETVFEPFAGVLDQADLLAILGNHDVMDGNGPGQLEVLGMERYWAWTQDDTLVIGLDSNDLDDAQLAWLDRTLAGADETWRIVAIHHPPYSAGYQGSSLEVRDRVVPILRRHGVQLVLSGHDHDYQRSNELDGVTYVVSGAGSGTRRTGSRDFTAVSFAAPHFLDIAIYPDRLLLRPVTDEGEVGDSVEIRP
jgi:3',5'-cyclic AMP phosphodiesterase CpdA